MERTKQEEIDAYRKFVADQPRGSYLAAILKDSEFVIANQIRNDFALPLAGELRDRQLQAMEADDKLRDTQKKLAAAQEALREIERKHRQFEESMRQLRTDARKLASV